MWRMKCEILSLCERVWSMTDRNTKDCCGNMRLVAAGADKLRMARQLQGRTAVGAPPGSAEHVSHTLAQQTSDGGAAGGHTGATPTLCTGSVSPSACLDVMQARIVRLMQTMPRQALAPDMHCQSGAVLCCAVLCCAAAVPHLPLAVVEAGTNMEGLDKEYPSGCAGS